MATSKITLDEGTTTNTATNTIAEDAVTKHLPRSVINTSAGVEVSLATSTKQSDGSQKTQVVDGAGNVIGATSNALDINIKSGNPTTITATQATGSNLKVEASNNGTFAVQAAQSVAANLNCTEASAADIKTSVQLIDNIVGSINGAGAPVIDSYTHKNISAVTGANQLLVSSAANKQVWVYGLGFTISAAGTVSFQDEDDTAITGVMPIDTKSGMVVSPSGNFAMPIWKLATDKDLEVDVVTGTIDGWLDYAIVSV